MLSLPLQEVKIHPSSILMGKRVPAIVYDELVSHRVNGIVRATLTFPGHYYGILRTKRFQL